MTLQAPADSHDGARRRDDAADLRERLAAIEHERWADWQRYMHGQCRPLIGAGTLSMNQDWIDALVIPSDLVERWERQIATPYADLSEPEKDSDRQQVDRYWPLVADLLATVARLEAERDEARADADRRLANLQTATRERDEARMALDTMRVLRDEWMRRFNQHAGAENATIEAMRPVYEVLAALVALKDGPRGAAYEHRKPSAWEAARVALAAVDQTAPSSPLETPQTADGGEAGVVEGAGGSEAAEGRRMDCPERCEVPAGVHIVETPPAGSDVVRCPNNGCEKTFLVILDYEEVGTNG